MKRYIKASISESTPDWLRRKLTGGRWGNGFRNNLLKKYHIALDRAEYTYEPGADTIPIYLLPTDYGEIVYAPGVNDEETTFINGRNRKLGSIAKSKLPEMAVDTVYVSLSDANTFDDRKDRYKDPRYTYRHNARGDYAGQYMKQEYDSATGEYHDTEWSQTGKTPSNESRARDKSGYKIPSPEERLTAYYEKFPDRVTDKVDDVYDGLVATRSNLLSADFKNTDIDMSRAYRYFSDAISDYNRLLDALKQKEAYGDIVDGYTIRRISSLSQDIKSRLRDVEAILNGERVW